MGWRRAGGPSHLGLACPWSTGCGGRVRQSEPLEAAWSGTLIAKNASSRIEGSFGAIRDHAIETGRERVCAQVIKAILAEVPVLHGGSNGRPVRQVG
jgi:hypothetical protein